MCVGGGACRPSLVWPSLRLPAWAPPPQISPDEIQTAMTFLREQLGEDELRLMLEMLSTESDGGMEIDVNRLLEIAGVVESAGGKEERARD